MSTEHYFNEKQTSPLVITEVDVILKGYHFKVLCASGVFASKKIDKGTEVLIQYAQIKDNTQILDLGCGVGVVGIALQKEHSEIKVTYTDINERALMITKKNLKKNKCKGIVKKSNCYEQLTGEKFDTILCNVPQKAGKKVCFEIIKNAPLYLKKNGSLQIVALHNKGGKTLRVEMENTFGNVQTLGKKAGYHVYASTGV